VIGRQINADVTLKWLWKADRFKHKCNLCLGYRQG